MSKEQRTSSVPGQPRKVFATIAGVLGTQAVIYHIEHGALWRGPYRVRPSEALRDLEEAFIALKNARGVYMLLWVRIEWPEVLWNNLYAGSINWSYWHPENIDPKPPCGMCEYLAFAVYAGAPPTFLPDSW